MFAKEEELKWLHCIRQYSKNNSALTLASACLFRKYRLN